MKLNKIILQNFKCFTSLEFDFNQQGLFLFTGQNLQNSHMGANGIGKSTLFDAICFALYGKTAKGTKSSKLLSRGFNNYSVELIFDSFSIKRTWNPIQVQINNSEVAQDEIDRKIGLTYNQFLYAIYISQNPKHFIDFTAGEKLTFLSSLFQLDTWISRADHCKSKLDRLHQNLNETTFRKQTNTASMSYVQSLIKGCEINAVTWEKERQQRVKTILGNLEVLSQEIIEAPDNPRELEIIYGEKQQEKRQLDNSITSIHVNQRELIHERVTLQAEITKLERKAEDLLDNNACNECNQNLSESKLEEMSTKLLEELEAKTSTLRNLEACLNSHDPITELQEKQITMQKELMEIYDTIQNIKRSTKSLEQTQTQIESAERALKYENNQLNPYVHQQESQEIQVAFLDKDIKSCVKNIEKLDKEIKEYEYWSKEFPKIRLAILDQVIAELDMHFNNAFVKMGLLDWNVEISTEKNLASGDIKKEFTIKIKSNECELDFDTLSGGELQRIRLATSIGISDLIKARLGIDWTLMLLDEPSGIGLSEEGFNDMVGMLSELSSTNEIYLAEHRNISSTTNFDKIYQIIKNPNGVSEIND